MSSFLLALSVLVPVAFSLPSQALVPRATIDCVDYAAISDTTCWSTLKTSQFLLNWSPPQCKDNTKPQGCCRTTENWSECFIRIGGGKDKWNCTGVTIDTNICNENAEQVDTKLSPAIIGQVRYVLHNIFTVNNVFSNYYASFAQSAGVVLASQTQSLIDEVGPKKPFVVADILDALSASIAFVYTNAPNTPYTNSGAPVITQAFIDGLQKTPGVAEAIWPSGPDESISLQAVSSSGEAAQESTFEATFANASTVVLGRLNAGLAILMTNKTSFVSFVESGALSGTSIPDEPSSHNGYDLVLGTYLTSTALSANGFYVSVTPKSNVADPSWTKTCTSGGVGICYQDAVSDFTYQLSGGKNAAQSAATALNPTYDWTNPQVLFQSAWNCTIDGSGMTNLVNLNADGSLLRTCPSQLPVCAVYSGVAECPVALVNGACPVKACS